MGEGSLSQEDIDALLTGGGGESAAPSGGGGSDFNLSGELDSLLGGEGGGTGTGGGIAPELILLLLQIFPQLWDLLQLQLLRLQHLDRLLVSLLRLNPQI